MTKDFYGYIEYCADFMEERVKNLRSLSISDQLFLELRLHNEPFYICGECRQPFDFFPDIKKELFVNKYTIRFKNTSGFPIAIPEDLVTAVVTEDGVILSATNVEMEGAWKVLPDDVFGFRHGDFTVDLMKGF